MANPEIGKKKRQLHGGSKGEIIPGLTKELTKDLGDEHMNEEDIIGKYREKGKRLNSVKGGDFICVDSEGYRLRGKEYQMGRNTDKKEFKQRINLVGFYAINNGILSYVDGEGKQYVGAASEENKKILEEAGYKIAGNMSVRFFVPFSNGEEFTNEILNRIWHGYIAKAEGERSNIEVEDIMEKYREKGKGLNSVKGGDFICVDSEGYRLRGKEYQMGRNTDKKEFKQRINLVGFYAINNGILSYVDGEGKQYVGAASEENKKILEEAGYKIAGNMSVRFFVPFSNGEEFTNEILNMIWRGYIAKAEDEGSNTVA